MKRIFILIVMAMTVIYATGKTQKYYCEVKGVERELIGGLKIVFDFGINPVYSVLGGLNSKQKLVDEKGEEIPFNSMVDAGNYLSDKGWSFVQAYTSFYSQKSISHWIFVKEADSPEDAVKGILTKADYKKQKKSYLDEE